MLKFLALSSTLSLTMWSPASACSPILQLFETESSYEDRIRPYLVNIHRDMVDETANIVVGTFKYSRRKDAHKFKISESLKRSKTKSSKKKVSVKFKDIEDARVQYEASSPYETRNTKLVNQKIPITQTYGVWGGSYISYDDFSQGDCGASAPLRLTSNKDYLIFATEDFEITAMFVMDEQTEGFKTQIENLVQNPSDPYGKTISLKDMLKKPTTVRLLTTEACSPVPSYEILRSGLAVDEGKKIASVPIMVVQMADIKYLRDATLEEKSAARHRGLKTGLFTNTPALANCKIGQKYLSLGGFLGPNGLKRDGKFFNKGQMIAETNGAFDLSQTIYEYHITPTTITADEVVDLLDSYTP